MAEIRLDRPAGVDLLAGATRRLAAAGPGAVDEVLAVLAAALAADVSLRPPAARPPAAAGAVLEVPVRAGGMTRGVLRVVAATSLDPAGARLATAVADLLGLALAAAPADPARAVLDLEADLAEVAGVLHAGVGRAVVAARYAAERAAEGRLPVAALPEAVQAVLEPLDGLLRDLRPGGLDGRLGAALRALDGDRAWADGGEGRDPLRVAVHATDPALDAVSPAAAVLALRVTLAALAGTAGSVEVRAAVADGLLKLTLWCAENPYDGAALDRWARRAWALGGTLERDDHGVALTVPAT